MSARRSLWQRYVEWRRGDGVSRDRSDPPTPNKVAADESDVIRQAHSNAAAGWS